MTNRFQVGLSSEMTRTEEICPFVNKQCNFSRHFEQFIQKIKKKKKKKEKKTQPKIQTGDFRLPNSLFSTTIIPYWPTCQN